MARKKYPQVIHLDELKQKGTKELLGYLKRLRKCEESFEKSDMMENIDLLDSELIYFKQTEKWKRAYIDVKAVLDTREHTP